MSSPATVPVELEHFIKVDWRETSRSHCFSIEVPGIAWADVKVYIKDVVGATLKITAKTDSTTMFSRQFTLPEDVITMETKACLKDGVLTVLVPKRVSVRSNDGDANRAEVTVTDSEVIYTLGVPGLKTRDVKVDVLDAQAADDDGPALKRQRLVVSGEWNTRRPEIETWHCQERSYGFFVNEFGLPSGIEAKSADLMHRVDNGLLTVAVPKNPALVIPTDDAPPPPAYRDVAAADDKDYLTEMHKIPIN